MKVSTYLSVEKVSLQYPICGIVKPTLKSNIYKKIIDRKMREKGQEQSIQTSIQSLNDISFTLKTGDCVHLRGHNGAGKSTLLRVLAGIYKPTNGSVYCDGKINSLLGLSAGALMRCTGIDNIYRILMLNGLSKEEAEQKIPYVRDFSGLNQYLEFPVSTYSDGMLVRLMFSIAICQKPDVLLIDEIIGAGDQEFIIKSQNKIKELIGASSIAIISTHSTDFVEKICNKSLTLNQGQLVSLT